VPITCIERVIVAVNDLDDACAQWSKAGFAFGSRSDGCARLHAGAIAIDLCPADEPQPTQPVWKSTLVRGGGIVGWTWGTDAAEDREFATFLPGVITSSIALRTDLATRCANLDRVCGANQNTVDYLEHLVVMTPSLEDAIAAHEKIGLPCKRIREAGGGMRQAFFKLEQTVLEIVGPARGEPGVWGLAFMCKEIRRAVDLARENGLEATEPKTAIQGGKIARLVTPLDGVAIAYMEAPNPSS
jgi:hypothetical protein